MRVAVDALTQKGAAGDVGPQSGSRCTDGDQCGPERTDARQRLEDTQQTSTRIESRAYPRRPVGWGLRRL